VRWPLRGGGVIFVLLGAVWLLQGANIIGGSRMSGSPFWFGMGAVLVVAGAVLVYRGFRRRGTVE
jgi:hypothetical protein